MDTLVEGFTKEDLLEFIKKLDCGIIINSLNDLENFCKKVNIGIRVFAIGKLNNRNNQKFEELASLCVLLKKIIENGKLSCPFTIQKSLHPDFIIESFKQKAGIEVSEATSKGTKMFYKFLRKSYDGNNFIAECKSFSELIVDRIIEKEKKFGNYMSLNNNLSNLSLFIRFDEMIGLCRPEDLFEEVTSILNKQDTRFDCIYIKIANKLFEYSFVR